MPSKEILDRGCFIDPKHIPEGLTRKELSRQAKMEHLQEKGMSFKEANEVCDKLYPKE